MPTYEYRCKECEHELEVQQSFTDDALTDCPACEQPSLKKKFSAVGISFKGSGFYKTDSRGSTSSSTTSSSSSTTGTTEAAPASTPKESSPSGDSSGSSAPAAATA